MKNSQESKNGIAAGAAVGAVGKRRKRQDLQPFSMIPEMEDNQYQMFEYKTPITHKIEEVRSNVRNKS